MSEESAEVARLNLVLSRTTDPRSAVLQYVHGLVKASKVVFQGTKSPYVYVARTDDCTLTFQRNDANQRFTLGIELPGLSLWLRSSETGSYTLFNEVLALIKLHERNTLAPAVLQQLQDRFGGEHA